MKVSLIQMMVTDHQQVNMNHALEMIQASQGELIILPEMFISPYQTDLFEQYIVTQDELDQLSSIARKKNCFIIAGSVPEEDHGKLYNTSFVFDDQGRIVGKYRKCHLFDIAIKNGQHFQESATLSAGSQYCIVDIKGIKIGIVICYDIRFPEMFRYYQQQGCEIVVVPASFNETTGPLHWQLLFQARAVDYSIYTIGASAAKNNLASYHSYGHSIICDPFARVIVQADNQECIIEEDLDMDVVKQIREQLPILKAYRTDIL